ncbi:ferritin family protein [Sporomusa sp. KB1]|jgi:rubrerythrin|uniref:ferritin-like domain-containing protein n=1 Tax=Sporomusa sp. KB1 TaxID=943346 RepID=UPI0011A3FD9B|nr:ferritin family protein [Sporomusa sp. KB1]TWH51980.1 rubrerythrin [Sporomusa sp. KB1]
MTKEEYKKILSLAISNEGEAYEYYKGVSEKTTDKFQKKLFRELADEEQGHKKALEGFLNRDISALHFYEGANYTISESVEKPKLTLDMRPADAVALAMKNEEEAMIMYSEFATASSDPGQKKIFEDLSLMEKGHKTKLEELYTNMAFPESW